jgi:hypothetical protein
MRRYDARRAKLHRNYTATEIARLFRVNIGTVWKWSRNGLEPIDRHRPFLFMGATIREYIGALNPPHRPMQPGELFCVGSCNRPVYPKGDVVTLVPRTQTSADFHGICPHCGSRMFRRVRLAELADKAGHLTISYEDEAAPVSSDGERLQVTVSAEITS